MSALRPRPIRRSPPKRWTFRDALQTRQFWIIAAAYAAFLFCGITANSVSVAHLTQHGVAAVIAASMMSVEALLNSARAPDRRHRSPALSGAKTLLWRCRWSAW